MLLAAIGRYVSKGRGSYDVSGMEVESNGCAPTDIQRGNGGGDAGGGIELVKTGGNGLVSVESRHCTCGEGRARCGECKAGADASVRLQLETWSAHKTVAFAVVIGAFAIWAIVFGVCLNLFNL